MKVTIAIQIIHPLQFSKTLSILLENLKVSVVLGGKCLKSVSY